MLAFDPYETWLGIPADRRPPTHYDLLGLDPFESDAQTIEQAALRRMGRVRHQQIGPHSDLSQEILAELARARLILMDPDRRGHYDARLRAQAAGVVEAVNSPDDAAKGDATSGQAERVEGALSIFKSIVDSPTPEKGPAIRGSAPKKVRSRWKKGVRVGLVGGSHGLLIWATVVFLVPEVRKRMTPPAAPTPSPIQPAAPKVSPPGGWAKTAPLPSPPVEVDRTPMAWHEFDGRTRITIARSGDFDMTSRDYTIFARIRTERGGTIFSRTAPDSRWVPNGKSLFVRNGKLTFEIGGVDCVEATRPVADGDWHAVAMTFSHGPGRVRLFVDGRLAREKALAPTADARDHVVRIGSTAPDYPCGQNEFIGDVSEVRFYQRALTQPEIAALPAEGPRGAPAVGRWTLATALGASVADQTGGGHLGTVEVAMAARAVAMTDGEAREESDRGSGPGTENRRREKRKPANPEDVLKMHGLVRSGSLYILEHEEEAVREAAAEERRLRQKLSVAREMRLQGPPNADERQRLESWLEEQIWQYHRSIELYSWDIDHVPRFRGWARNNGEQAVLDNWVATREQLQIDLRRAKDALHHLRTQPYDPEAKAKIDATLRDAQDAYENSVNDLHRLVGEVKEKYQRLKENDEIQGALDSLGRRSNPRPKVQPTPALEEIARRIR